MVGEMTGFKSKKAAALDEEGMYLVHHTQPAQEPVCPACKAEVLYECVACSNNNYPAQPAQEAVAWCPVCGDKGFPWPKCGHITYLERTNPPQRPWVGLTDEDKQELDEKYGDDYLAHLDAVEAKLKHKNT